MNNPFEQIDQRLDNIEKYLSELVNGNAMTPQLSTKPIDEATFDIDALAGYLKCAKSTIHRYKNNKIFPFYKAGRTVFFKKSEVDAGMSSIPQNIKKRS